MQSKVSNSVSHWTCQLLNLSSIQ